MNQKEKSKYLRNRKGITLVALVVTIIVLIILAGVSINLVLGDNGIITKAREAARVQEISEIKEGIRLEIVGKQLSNNGEITENELKEILEKRGTLTSEENILDRTLKTTDGAYEIKVSEIYNGKLISVEPTTPEDPIIPEEPTITIAPKTITAEIESGTVGTEVGTITATVSNVEGDLQWSITPTDSGLELVDTDDENIKKIKATKAVENATITVSYGTASDTCTVTVTEKETTQEDELAGTWVFNDTITLKSSGTTYNLEFVSESECFSSIVFSTENIGPDTGHRMYYIYNNGSSEFCYEEFCPHFGSIRASWELDYCKTISISTRLEEMENGEEFLEWLKANATKQD